MGVLGFVGKTSVVVMGETSVDVEKVLGIVGKTIVVVKGETSVDVMAVLGIVGKTNAVLEGKTGVDVEEVLDTLGKARVVFEGEMGAKIVEADRGSGVAVEVDKKTGVENILATTRRGPTLQPRSTTRGTCRTTKLLGRPAGRGHRRAAGVGDCSCRRFAERSPTVLRRSDGHWRGRSATTTGSDGAGRGTATGTGEWVAAKAAVERATWSHLANLPWGRMAR